MRPAHAESIRPGGFALLIVLWMLVLISFIVGYVTATGRSEIQIARNIAANATVAAAADGAVYRVIYAFTDPQQDRRPPTGGSPQEMRIGHSIVDVRVFDENDSRPEARYSPASSSAERSVRAVPTHCVISSARSAAVSAGVFTARSNPSKSSTDARFGLIQIMHRQRHRWRAWES